MSEYRIFETEQFQKDLKKNLGPGQENLIKKLGARVYPRLTTQPYFGQNIKKLRGYKPETWRYRICGYRFFYEIDQEKKIVFMVAADTRQKSY